MSRLFDLPIFANLDSQAPSDQEPRPPSPQSLSARFYAPIQASLSAVNIASVSEALRLTSTNGG